MTLAIFKYGLPVLLGYTLFVGVSGRLNPFALPYYRQERASWYLGIWTGIAVSVVLAVGLYLATNITKDSAHSLLLPFATVLAILMAPAIGIYAYFRHHSATIANHQKSTNFDWGVNDDELRSASESNADQILSTDTPTANTLPDNSQPPEVSPTYLESLQIDQVNDAAHGEAVNESSDPSPSDAPRQEMPGTSTEPELSARLAEEISLREQTETHLRITRKALSVLEADTRHHSIDKADAVIELEEKLAERIDAATAFEATAEKEKAKRVEIENGMIELKQKMVDAKREIRRSAAARAKALSTANKSIAFARQSVQIRARLETKLNEVQSTLDNRQKTMSSLVRALEREKRKTQQEIQAAARQIVLNEKQLKAKRSLEEVARSVENKLTSRLVKKVARARPLTPDMNHGEAK